MCGSLARALGRRLAWSATLALALVLAALPARASLATPTGSFTLDSSTTTFFDSAAPMPDGGLAALFRDGNGIRTLRLYDPSGVLQRSVGLNALSRYSGLANQGYLGFSIFALANGNLAVIYNSEDSANGAGYMDAWFFVLDPAGNKLFNDVQINTTTGNSQTRWIVPAQLAGGNLAFAYQLSTNSDIGVRVFSPSTGAAVSAEYVVAGSTPGFGMTGNRALYPYGFTMAPQSGGGFLVVWYAGTPTYTVMAMQFNASGVQQNIGASQYLTLASGGTNSSLGLCPVPGGKMLFGINGWYGTQNYRLCAEDLSDYASAAVRTAPDGASLVPTSVVPMRTPGGLGYALLVASFYTPPTDGDYTGTDTAAVYRYDTAGAATETGIQIGTGYAWGIWDPDGWYDQASYNSFYLYPGYHQGLVAITSANPPGNTTTYVTSVKTYELPVGAAPTDLALGNATLSQSAAGAGATVGTLSTTDADSSSFTYTLVAGTGSTNNAAFTLSGATLKVGASALAAGTYSVRIQTSDGGNTFAKAFTITVTAAAPGQPAITGVTIGDGQATVSFTAPASDGGATITGYTVTANPGGFTGTGSGSPITVSGLSNGTAYTFTVTATNSAGTGPASSASASVTPKASQTITFANPDAQNFGTSPTLTATASSGLTVRFSSAATAVATITPGGALTFVSAGTATITADQDGNGTYLPAATVSRSFTVNAVVPGQPAIGTVVAGSGQATVSFTAPASSGGAAITGYVATSSPGGFTGSSAGSPITVSGLSNGTAYTFTVTATNSAGTGPASSASASVTPKASQTITFNNPGAQNFGTGPTLTATATSGLTVRFSSATPAVATITPGGALTFVSAGTATINADQDGNGTYLPAATVSRSFAVNAVVPGQPAIGTAVAGSGQATVSFTAPASSGGAAVTSYVATSNPGGFTGTSSGSPITVGGLSNGTAYTFTVVAINSAGGGTASAASNSVTPRASQTITFANPGAQNFGTSPTLTASSSSGLTVRFTSTTPSVATVTSGGVLTFLTTGTATIQADQDGNGTWLPAATVVRSFGVTAVAPGRPTVTGAAGGPGQATISFAAPAFTGGAAITGYTVTANPGGRTAAGAGSPLTVDGLTNGTAYTFTVTATNSAGTGSASDPSPSVTPALTAPGAPTGVAAQAQDGAVLVSFQAPAYTGGTTITGYTVTASPGGQTVQGAGSPLTVSGLPNHAACTFTVTATNPAGTSAASAATDPVIPTPGGRILVLHDGTAGANADRADNLAQLAHACLGLTVDQASLLPSSLDVYDQVWDLRCGDGTPLDSADRTAFLAFLGRGGQLFLAGSGPGAGVRDASLLTFLDLAGITAGPLEPALDLDQAVQAPFTGPVPATVAGFGPSAAALASYPQGRPAALEAGSRATVVAWVPGTLPSALPGGLVAGFAADFLASTASAADRAFLANLLNHQTRVARSVPVVTGVDLPAAGAYRAGQTLAFTVHFSGPVTVTGTPVLPLSAGATAMAAAYASGSGTADLRFTLTIPSSANGSPVLGAALSCVTPGGALSDADGFPVRTALAGAGSTAGIRIDTAAPAAPTVLGAAGLTLTGTAEPGSVVDVYLGSTWLGSVTADGSGNWSWSLPADQAGTVTAVAADPAGNRSSASGGVSVDTSRPVAGAVDLAVTADSTANPVPLSLSGGSAGSVAVAQAPGHGTASAAGTAITYTPDPGYVGSDQFSYTASNANGTSAAAQVTVTVRPRILAAPALDPDMLADGAVTAQLLITVAGTVTAPNGLQSLTLNGAQVPVQAGGRFSYPLHLARGANAVVLAATDQAGLATTVSRTVHLDLSVPEVVLSQPADGAVVADAHLEVAGTVTLAPGSAADPVVSVSWSLNGGTEQAAVQGGSAFTFSVDLAPGSNQLDVTATLASGRTARCHRSVILGSGLLAAVTDPGQDLLVTASTYDVRGTVATDALPATVTIDAAGQTYTPPVLAGTFVQAVPLAAEQIWPVVVTITDNQARSVTVVRNFLKATAATPAVFTLVDAQRALMIANGLLAATAEDLARYDLAPRSGGVSAGDGAITLEDAVLVLWLADGHTL